MTDIFWNGLFICIATIVVAYFQMRTRNAVNDAATKAAVKTEEVRTTLRDATATTEGKLVDLKKVANDTHTLVNSNMGIQLRLNAVVTKRLAEVTKDPEDIKAAGLAQSLYDDHVAKQAVVDSGALTQIGGS